MGQVWSLRSAELQISLQAILGVGEGELSLYRKEELTLTTYIACLSHAIAHAHCDVARAKSRAN